MNGHTDARTGCESRLAGRTGHLPPVRLVLCAARSLVSPQFSAAC
jgi:hypothetical protein